MSETVKLEVFRYRPEEDPDRTVRLVTGVIEMSHVDGNAIAGALSLAMGRDVSAAVLVCGACGTEHPVGEAHVYLRCPGMVIRCPNCTAAEIVLVEIDHRVQLTVATLATIEFTPR